MDNVPLAYLASFDNVLVLAYRLNYNSNRRSPIKRMPEAVGTKGQLSITVHVTKRSGEELSPMILSQESKVPWLGIFQTFTVSFET